MNFSVVMGIYRNDSADDFKTAVQSVYKEQSFKPNEIIIVIDGPIPRILEQTVENLKNEIPIIKVIRQSQNKGLGNALRIGVEAAKYNIIARMDSDDISMPARFEKQLEYLKMHPECDIVGGQITEFIGKETNVVSKREVPCSNNAILSRIKSRCPFNHMTVMFKKSSVLSVGNYIDWHFNEDYYLWIRMVQAGCKFANLPDVLVNVRVGKDMYARRGGWKYFKSEAKLQKYMLNQKIISFPRFLYNVTGRFAVQILMPNKIRGFLFQKLFRK